MVTSDKAVVREKPVPRQRFSSSLFWVTLIALSLLMIAGVVGQMFGLRSIESYTRLRGQLVAVESEHARLSESNKVLRSTFADLRAQHDRTETDYSKVLSRLGEVQAEEKLALDAVGTAQRRLTELQNRQRQAESARDAAAMKEQTAKGTLDRIGREVSALTAQRDNLEQAIRPLRDARASFKQTLEDRDTEMKKLNELSIQVGEMIEARDQMSSRAARLKEQVAALETRRDVIGELEDDIAVLQADRDQAARDLPPLKNQLVQEQKRFDQLRNGAQSALADQLAAERKIADLRDQQKELETELDVLEI